MLNGTHDDIDFSLVINAEYFTLFYLVDGIYPWASQFLATINDPTMSLDSIYVPKQVGWWKLIERAFVVWKKEFLLVGTKTLLQKHDKNFYLLIAMIVMHNMVVAERVENSELKSSDFL
jgi:hypothetical protein